MPTTNKKYPLTPLQIKFIKCAYDCRNAVLPFTALDDDIFEQDYGISKKEWLKEIKALYKQLS